MPWPSPDAYYEAVQNPQTCFFDPDLKAGRVTTNPLGLPCVQSGSFASVYEIRTGSQRWGVRCFLRQVSDQQKRYVAVSRHLSGVLLPCLIAFEYQEQGIRVRGQSYPIVKMEWVEGKLLNAFVEAQIQNPKALLQLAARWRGLVNSLHGNRLAHGDLQHGNVLVTAQGEIKLVDYDAMFVPALHGKTSPELGHRNYQHPQRTAGDFDNRLDNLAAIVIYLSLRALAANASLWQQFYTGENLIFSSSDYKAPGKSAVFRRLQTSSDLGVRALAAELERCCLGAMAQIPEFESSVYALQATSASPPPPVATQFSSSPSPQIQTQSWWKQTFPTLPQTSSLPSPVNFKKNPKDDADMIFIPVGEFLMGSNDYNIAKPVHKVMLDGYYIYRTPVTAAQYLKFCDDTRHARPPAPSFNPNWSKLDHPIVNVTYKDTLAYCAWASVKLPTEAQWEKAARGTDGRVFPWGNAFDRRNLWCSKSKWGDTGGTTSVGSYLSGVSPFGVLEMAGNVWQWCSDWYDAGFYGSQLATERNPENQSIGPKQRRVVRGGAWGDLDQDFFRCAYRFTNHPGFRNDTLGFRCCAS